MNKKILGSLFLLFTILNTAQAMSPDISQQTLKRAGLTTKDLECFQALDEYYKRSRHFIFVYNDKRILPAVANVFVEGFGFNLKSYDLWKTWYKKFSKKLKSSPDKHFFHAVIKDGDIAAAALFSYNENKTDIYLDLLVVHKKFHKNGLGRKLIQSIFEQHRLVQKITLETYRHNNNATNAFYQKIGGKRFRIDGDKENWCYRITRKTFTPDKH